jgi:hypothetical protein
MRKFIKQIARSIKRMGLIMWPFTKKTIIPIEKLDTEEFDVKQKAQINRIEYDKWIAGEKLHSDPGNTYIMEWIETYGSDFHDEFIISDCRTCKKCWECGGSVKFQCFNYDPQLNSQSFHLLKKVFAMLEIHGATHATIDKMKIHYGLDNKKKE